MIISQGKWNALCSPEQVSTPDVLNGRDATRLQINTVMHFHPEGGVCVDGVGRVTANARPVMSLPYMVE